MSPWIDHVKQFQSAHPGMSYREALSAASPSYRSISGGKFRLPKHARGVKKLIRQGKNTVNKAQHLAEANQDVFNKFDEQFGTNTSKGVGNALSQAQHLATQAEHVAALSGGKFNLARAVRKTKHTVGRVGKISKKAINTIDTYGMPALEALGVAVAPEVVAAYEGAKLASTLSGGSFRVGGAGIQGGCAHCGHGVSGAGVKSSVSSLVTAAHPSFTPKRQKTFKRLVHEN